MKVILLGSFAGNNAGDMVVLESIIYDFERFITKGIENGGGVFCFLWDETGKKRGAGGSGIEQQGEGID